jgi:hypothetical protein
MDQKNLEENLSLEEVEREEEETEKLLKENVT